MSHTGPAPAGSRHARSLAEALERCAHHGSGALAESLGVVCAAIDAASFVFFGSAADDSPLEPFWILADELGAGLRRSGVEGEALLRVFAEALDEEIERWERQGRDDPEARAVSRVFAELRELLRQFGLPKAGPRRSPASPRDAAGPTVRRRV